MNEDVFLCLTRDVEPGHYRSFSIFGEDLVARNDYGNISVAFNRCRHRGMKVAGSCGQLKDGIACPYHGLTFDFEENLPVWQRGEMVFVGDMRTDLEGHFEYVAVNLGESFGTVVTDLSAPFYLWVQNTADPNHLRTVHKRFSSVFDTGKPYGCEIRHGFSEYKLSIKDEVKARFKKIVKRKNKTDYDEVFYHAIVFPHLSVTSFLNIFYSIETALPMPGGSIVETRFFVSKDVEVPEPVLKEALRANEIVLEEDRQVVNRFGFSYRHDVSPKWLRGEERIKAYMSEIYQRGFAPEMKRGIFL